MWLHFVFLFSFWLFVKSSDGVTSIELHFASNNCDEEPRSLSADKSYNLTWNGQITPKLCSFTFNRGWEVTEICFQSTFYDLQYSMGNIEIKITNYTKSAWDYDRFDNNIPHICVKKAYKLVVSILVPTGYTAPSPNTYLQLRITGVKTTEDTPYPIAVTVVVVTCFILIGVFCFLCVKTEGKICQMILECLGNIFRCCADITRYFLNCECLRRHQPETNAAPPTQTDINDITEDSEDSVISGFADPAPSYQSIKDIDMKEDPTAPPPSYEEVVGRNVPSAPPEWQ